LLRLRVGVVKELRSKFFLLSREKLQSTEADVSRFLQSLRPSGSAKRAFW